ncbi:MAG: hypothetical protein KatS3mg024_2237 [Armatimonadota bacterium]|nr:MAG: hypothetical protein KatS3mg024_2237 [Armatimonadota bacterium]
MRTRAIRLLIVFLLLASACSGADAKWWIFGKSDEPVDFHYLYINNMSFMEKSEKITLFRDSLPEGRVIIRGKAKTKAGKVGSVEVSIDNRETWQKAKLGDSGAFEYSFKPELGKTYDLYIKVVDTTGKSNKIEDTYRQITLSDRDLMAAVREALQKLVDAYCQENPSAFMALVSDDFAGDAVLLDRAIRKDFTAFDQIDLRFNISSVASGAKGRIYVSLLYNRFMLSAKSGASFTDKGTTEFVFEQKDDGLLVWSMKNPLIFGLSDAGNVATGTVYTGGNDTIIVVDDAGNVQEVPFDQGINIIAGGGGGADFASLSNLRVAGGVRRHYLDLEFDTTLDPNSVPPGTYETIVEESLSAGGPWTEVERKDLDTFVRVMSDRIAQQAVMLYYRVRIQRLADGALSQPSNVVQWDNSL